MEFTFARGRSETELESVVGRLAQEGFHPYGGRFVLHEFWSVEEARARQRADVHYLAMMRERPSPARTM